MKYSIRLEVVDEQGAGVGHSASIFTGGTSLAETTYVANGLASALRAFGFLHQLESTLETKRLMSDSFSKVRVP